MRKHSALASRVRAAEPVFGIIASLNSPAVVEMIGWAGYDFVVVDAEHGSGDWSDHLALVRAAQGSGVAAIVRPPTGATEHLKRVIDIGADGILIPNVDDAAMARRFVDDLLYPPAGKRGAAVPMVRASRYGLNAAQYMTTGLGEFLVAMQIESGKAIEATAEIAATEGVDALVLGPFDLSGDLGIPGEFTNPDFISAETRFLEGCKAGGAAAGGIPRPDRSLSAFLESGHTFMTVTSDTLLFGNALTAMLPTAIDVKG